MPEITGSDPGEVIVQEIIAGCEVSGERFGMMTAVVDKQSDYLSQIRVALVELTRLRKDIRFWVESIEFWAHQLEPELVTLRNKAEGDNE